jgi:hypothetical protein
MKSDHARIPLICVGDESGDTYTFKDAGKVGVWTKADPVIYFYNLQIKPF